MMENILNIFHYSIYHMLNNVHIILNKINPLWLLFKIPFIENFHKKHNHNPRNKHDVLWMDDEKGYNIFFVVKYYFRNNRVFYIDFYIFIYNRIFFLN